MFFGLEVIGWKLSFSVFCFFFVFVVGRAPSLAHGQWETSHRADVRIWFAGFLLAHLRELEVVCLCVWLVFFGACLWVGGCARGGCFFGGGVV